MSASSGFEHPGRSSAGTKNSETGLGECPNPALGECAWLIELKLTAHPHTKNLAQIRRLIDIYGTKIKYLQDTLPSRDQGGMPELETACSYIEINDDEYRKTVRAMYRLKEEQRRQLQEHIARLQDRKRKLEEALSYSRHHAMFRAKMEPLINDYSKFSL